MNTEANSDEKKRKEGKKEFGFTGDKVCHTHRTH